MATMNISLPEDLKSFVDEQVAAHSYGSTSEYLRELIRRQRDVEKLRNMMLDGLKSGPAELVTSGTFKKMRKELRERIGK